MSTFYSLSLYIFNFSLWKIVELQEKSQIKDLIDLDSANFGDDVDFFIGENVHDMLIELLLFFMLDDKLLSRAEGFPPVLAGTTWEVVTKGSLFIRRVHNERFFLW